MYEFMMNCGNPILAFAIIVGMALILIAIFDPEGFRSLVKDWFKED